MAMYSYGIGGQERKLDNASEAISDIPLNRTLLVQKLTTNAPLVLLATDCDEKTRVALIVQRCPRHQH